MAAEIGVQPPPMCWIPGWWVGLAETRKVSVGLGLANALCHPVPICPPTPLSTPNNLLFAPFCPFHNNQPRTQPRARDHVRAWRMKKEHMPHFQAFGIYRHTPHPPWDARLQVSLCWRKTAGCSGSWTESAMLTGRARLPLCARRWRNYSMCGMTKNARCRGLCRSTTSTR